MYVKYNPNPVGRMVGDCAVRAVSKALGISWETAYAKMAANGFAMGDMPSSDSVWGAVLRENGFTKEVCPDCSTAADFCIANPDGTYVLGLGGHCAAVVNGKLYDSWDSSQEQVIYFWRKN